jgi:phage repressor protein C with HTH and peptisase S24 domain
MVSVEGKIAPGDKVVIEGHDNVRPGGTVTLVKND